MIRCNFIKKEFEIFEKIQTNKNNVKSKAKKMLSLSLKKKWKKYLSLCLVIFSI